IVLLGLQSQPHLLLAYLALVEEDVGDLFDADPLAVRDLGISDILPELDLPTCYVVTHLSVLLKSSAMARLSPTTLPTIEYGGGQELRLYAIWTLFQLVSTSACQHAPASGFRLSAFQLLSFWYRLSD